MGIRYHIYTDRDKFAYLPLITDRYSRKIAGWLLSGNPGIEDSLETLKKALATCSNPERIIHHLDRGIRYCSHPYTKLLTRKGIQTSMTEENYCYENGLAERVNEILKEEYMLESCFKDVLSCDALLTITVEGGSNSHGFVRIGGCRCTLISLHFFRC